MRIGEERRRRRRKEMGRHGRTGPGDMTAAGRTKTPPLLDNCYSVGEICRWLVNPRLGIRHEAKCLELQSPTSQGSEGGRKRPSVHYLEVRLLTDGGGGCAARETFGRANIEFRPFRSCSARSMDGRAMGGLCLLCYTVSLCKLDTWPRIMFVRAADSKVRSNQGSNGEV